MKFSFCLIAKNEAKVLPRLLKSLDEFKANGGEVCLLDTGSTDDTAQIARDWGCKVEEVGDKYTDTIPEELANAINRRFRDDNEQSIVRGGDEYFDFASARNHAASLASNDMVSFVDADEQLTTLDFNKINELIDQGFEQFEYNFVFAHDRYGKPAIEFVQSKFYDRRKVKWVGLVHEVLSGQAKIGFLNNEIFRLEHFQEPHDRHSYLRGLAVDCFNNPHNDRNSHYFARELFWTGRPKSALKEFERHIKMNGWHSERAESLIFMGDIYARLNNPEKQAEMYSKAFYIDSGRREPLMKLAEFYLWNKNYQAAASYAKGAMEIPWNGFYATNKAYYEHLPYEILYKAYGWLGRIPEAQQAIMKALEYQPNNPEYNRDVEYYFGPKDPTDYLDKGIEGWMTWKDLKWLHKVAKEGDIFVEVGSWAGRSSDAILSGKASKVYCVDTWKGSKDTQDLTNGMAKERDMLEVFKKNVGHYPHLNIIVKPSVEAAKDFADKSIDICFIDAGHTYEEVLQDIDAWLPKVKDDGILCGHDYLPGTWMGVVQAVNERFGKPDEIIDWVWVVDFKKRNSTQKIPKKIWTCWFGDPMPDVVKKSIASQHIPGYEHFVLTEENFKDDSLTKIANAPEYVKVALANKKWVKAKDYLEAWILQTYGGIFLDADQEILPGKNFDDLLDHKLFASIEENGFVGSSLIGSVPNHPLWEEYFKQVHEKFTPLDGKNFESSMEIFTHLMYQHNGKDAVILRSDYFFPYNHQTGIINVTPNTRTFHHFMKTWTDISPDLLPTVSIIIPQLGRPEGLKRCLESIDRLYYPKHLVEVLVIEGDESVPVKVAKGLEMSKGEWICYAANDIEFTPTSLYEAVTFAKRENKALVAFNTGEVYPDKGNINEHFIIRKSFIPSINGQIFDLDFNHVGVDNYLWALADQRKEAARCESAVIKHYHFSRGFPNDEVYQRGWQNLEKDREVLNQKLGELYARTNNNP